MCHRDLTITQDSEGIDSIIKHHPIIYHPLMKCAYFCLAVFACERTLHDLFISAGYWCKFGSWCLFLQASMLQGGQVTLSVHVENKTLVTNSLLRHTNTERERQRSDETYRTAKGC